MGRVPLARVLACRCFFQRLLQTQHFGLPLVAIRGHALLGFVADCFDRGGLLLANCSSRAFAAAS